MKPFEIQKKYFDKFLSDCPPLAFVYDRQDFEDIYDEWNSTYTVDKKEDYSAHSVTYLDPKSQLNVNIEYKVYKKFPAIEWVAHFHNKGQKNSPIIKNILPLQIEWNVPQDDPALLIYARGPDNRVDDFLPLSSELKHWEKEEITNKGGRSSDGYLPFFNLETGNKGMIIALGWSGQWKFSATKSQPVQREPYDVFLDAGMEKTHFVLYPEEKIRTPRMLIHFWTDNKIDGHNQFRRLLLKYYSPQKNGKNLHAPLCYPTWGATSMKTHHRFLDAIKEHQLKYEYYWVDAGWFVPDEEKRYVEDTGSWAEYVGNWTVNHVLYPKGIKELSDKIHDIGLKFLLWVEPERGRKGTLFVDEYPEFYLSKPGSKDLLYNLGDPKARDFLINFISNLISENKIECYRQDFNMAPLDYWRLNDTPDRVGISEIKHIEGLYQFWDELLKRHPDILIDNCASGGRRIDLETNSRSIPLWRSDLQCFADFDAKGSHLHSTGLMFWLPLSGTGTRFRPNDTYNVRSAFSSGLAFHHDSGETDQFDGAYPWDWHRKMINEFLRARPFYEGDYYPLTDLNSSDFVWSVYQCHRVDLDAGFILCFRHKKSPYVTSSLKLKALKTGIYLVEDSDAESSVEKTASELMDEGLNITIKEERSSRLIFYTKKK
jgi:alpha-galactosidase